jgi:O-antigen/teichoic acid export membrane protein
MSEHVPADDKAAGGLVLRGAAGTALGFVVRLGARVVLLLLAGRLYGAALFGAFGLAGSTVEILVALAGLSTKRTLFLALDGAEEQHRRAVHVTLDATVLVGGVGLALGATLALGLSAFHVGHRDVGVALLVLAPAIAGQALLDVIFAATRWAHVVRHEVIGRSLLEPYGAALGAVAAYALGWRNIGLAVGYDLGTLIALGYGLFALRRVLGPLRLGDYRPSRKGFVELLRTAQANTAVEVLKALYGRLDIYLVGLFLGEAPAGIYNAARQFRTPIRQLRQSFDSMLAPVTASTLRDRGAAATGDALISAARLLLLLQFPVLMAIAALGAPLLHLFGPSLAAGYSALLILAIAESVNGALSVGDLLFMYRRPKLGFVVTAVGMAAGAGLGMLLIPRFGVAGAAASVLGGYALNALLRIVVLRASLGARTVDASIAAVFVAGGVGLGVVVALLPLAPPGWPAWGVVTLVLGLAAYAVALFAWRSVSKTPLGLAGFTIRRPASAGAPR